MNDSHLAIVNSPSTDQREHIFQLLDQLFPVGRAYFEQRLLHDSSYHPATTWFAADNDTVAATAQIFPLHIRIGKAVIKVGGIGSVGTAIHYRGQGLAHKILLAQAAWMKEQNYDLSLLRAVEHRFYEKIGWQLIPEACYYLAAPASMQVQPQYALYEIIPFEPCYLDQLKLIYKQFNQLRTGTVVRDDAYWHDLMSFPVWLQSQCLLLRQNGSIIAYGIIEQRADSSTLLHELNYLPEAENEAGEAGIVQLLHALCQLYPDQSHILANLPQDHKLAPYLLQQGAELHEQRVSMWRLLNCDKLLRKLLPELEDRLQQSSFAQQSLYVQLHIEHQPHDADMLLHLIYNEGRLALTVENSEAMKTEAETCNYESGSIYKIKMAAVDLIASLLDGYKPAQVTETTGDSQKLLRALFPPQQAVFYWTDKF